jgi:hypothetical protein
VKGVGWTGWLGSRVDGVAALTHPCAWHDAYPLCLARCLPLVLGAMPACPARSAGRRSGLKVALSLSLSRGWVRAADLPHKCIPECTLTQALRLDFPASRVRDHATRSTLHNFHSFANNAIWGFLSGASCDLHSPIACKVTPPSCSTYFSRSKAPILQILMHGGFLPRT